MSIYVLQLSKPFHHSCYYVGYSETMEKLVKRVEHHKSGTGSTFTREALKQGITFELLVVFPNGTRENERAIKNQKNTKRFIKKLQNNKSINPDLTCNIVLSVTSAFYRKHWNYVTLLVYLMLFL